MWFWLAPFLTWAVVTTVALAVLAGILLAEQIENWATRLAQRGTRQLDA
jgi:hypothetical protein